MQCVFLGSDRLQETHMDALKPFNSKQLTLKMRGGFFTKFTALAHGAAWRGDACLRLLERGEHTTKDCITKDLSTFVDYLAHLSRNNCLRSNLFHEVVTPSSSLESRNINALGSS